MKHILKCEKCKTYTMKELCKCSNKAVTVKPAKYSPDEKYGGYRRKVKSEQWKKEGLL